MMKKLNRWLTNHALIWGWDEREGVLHLWTILISFLTLVFTGIFSWNVTLICAVMYLIIPFGLPLAAGIVALVKKEKWNPWYWFPYVVGSVIGGILAIVFCLMFGIISIY